MRTGDLGHNGSRRCPSRRSSTASARWTVRGECARRERTTRFFSCPGIGCSSSDMVHSQVPNSASQRLHSTTAPPTRLRVPVASTPARGRPHALAQTTSAHRVTLLACKARENVHHLHSRTTSAAARSPSCSTSRRHRILRARRRRRPGLCNRFLDRRALLRARSTLADDDDVAFSAPPTTQQKFDFGNPVPPRSGLSSPTPRFQLTNGSSPRRALSQTSSVMSVPSTSASQLDSSLALHDQHMRFTRRLSEVSSNGVHKPRPTRHQHIFAAQVRTIPVPPRLASEASAA